MAPSSADRKSAAFFFSLGSDFFMQSPRSRHRPGSRVSPVHRG
jgi:hypothetical protein